MTLKVLELFELCFSLTCQQKAVSLLQSGTALKFNELSASLISCRPDVLHRGPASADVQNEGDTDKTSTHSERLLPQRRGLGHPHFGMAKCHAVQCFGHIGHGHSNCQSDFCSGASKQQISPKCTCSGTFSFKHCYSWCKLTNNVIFHLFCSHAIS